MNHEDSRGYRDKETTKRRLVAATIELIRDSGFDHLGINAIAERAGLSKVLIYRYFEDLDGLLRAAAAELDPLQSEEAARLRDSVEIGQSPGEIMEAIVLQLHDSLARDKLTKQLMVAELSRNNEITGAMSVAREEVGLRLTDEFATILRDRDLPEGVDVYALFAIVSAAVSYLTLRSDSVKHYNGVDIQSRDGWERIGATMRMLIDAAADPGTLA